MLIAASAAANAAVSFVGLSTSDLSALTPVANAAPAATTGTYFDNVAGNQYAPGGSIIARSPWLFSSNSAGGVYSSVQAGSSATFEFDEVQTGMSLIWGSPDDYNDLIITLFGGGGTTVINGADVQGPVGILASLVTITDVLFEKVTFTSGKNAFEFANLTTSTSVPLPAGILLMVTALGGLVLVRRKSA